MTLRLEEVTRRVGAETHIHATTLTLEPGTLHVLLGATLAGKTTLMRLMAGLDRPSTGRVLEGGQDVTGTALQKRSVAMVYQQFINYPSLDVFSNIASPLRLRRLPKGEIETRVRETARMLRIDHLLDRLPAELSGGQQQRCAIARALVKEASLLLLDEPLVNLDFKLREELRAELRELFRRRRTIVVYATTEPHEALIMGGEVIVMHEGRVLQTGPTAEVYRRPASTIVGAVFSDPPMNLIDVEVADGRAMAGSGLGMALASHLAALRPGGYRLGFRANHVSMRQRSAHDLPVESEVELAEVSGSETFIHVRHGELAWVVQEEGVHVHELGEKVTVWLDPARLFAFDRQGALAAAPVVS